MLLCCLKHLQRLLQLFPRVRKMSSCVPITNASAPLCAATSSMTARTTALTRSNARQVPHLRTDLSTVWHLKNLASRVSLIILLRYLPMCFTVCVCLCSDTKLNDCRSNRTQCGDGDEAHCITNGTDSFCSCKPGFHKIGHRTCGGTKAQFCPCCD